MKFHVTVTYFYTLYLAFISRKLAVLSALVCTIGFNDSITFKETPFLQPQLALHITQDDTGVG
jgi:hypothetical protein